MRLQRNRRWQWISLALVSLSFAWALHVRGMQVPHFAGPAGPLVAGAYHLHSDRSHDSGVRTEDYVAAAQSLGLGFIILTDHNSQDSAPHLQNDVWVLASAELSTNFGHVVGLGAPTVLPEPLRTGPRPLEALEAASGAAIIAHPTDSKRPWTGPYAPAAGLEIANLSASARRQAGLGFMRLAQAILAWPFNQSVALLQAYDRDTAALALWDANPSPGFVGLCAVDAHGWIAPQKNLLGWQVVLSAESAGNPQSLLHALKTGHFFCTAGLLGERPDFRFEAHFGGRGHACGGASLAANAVTELVTTVPFLTVGARHILLLRDGVVVARTASETLRLPHPPAGTYRVEVWVALPRLLGGQRWVPGLYSNKLRLVPL